jgi:ribosomal protein L29
VKLRAKSQDEIYELLDNSKTESTKLTFE